MSRRNATSRKSKQICADVYEEILKARKGRALENVVFAFPHVMIRGEWRDPAAEIIAALIKRNDLVSSRTDPRAFSMTLDGVEDVEVSVDHDCMKQFRNVGCLVVTKYRSRVRVKVPGEYAGVLTRPTIAIVSIPPFQRGMTWNWPVIEALQRTSRNISISRGFAGDTAMIPRPDEP